MPAAGIVCLRPAFRRAALDTQTIMNISRIERRVLGVLALGGRINPVRDDEGRTIDIECYTREGWLMSDCTLDLFKRLRSKKVIASKRGGPYRITREGLEMLRG